MYVTELGSFFFFRSFYTSVVWFYLLGQVMLVAIVVGVINISGETITLPSLLPLITQGLPRWSSFHSGGGLTWTVSPGETWIWTL